MIFLPFPSNIWRIKCRLRGRKEKKRESSSFFSVCVSFRRPLCCSVPFFLLLLLLSSSAIVPYYLRTTRLHLKRERRKCRKKAFFVAVSFPRFPSLVWHKKCGKRKCVFLVGKPMLYTSRVNWSLKRRSIVFKSSDNLCKWMAPFLLGSCIRYNRYLTIVTVLLHFSSKYWLYIAHTAWMILHDIVNTACFKKIILHLDFPHICDIPEKKNQK